MTSSPKPRVLVTHWVHPEVLDLLRRECDVIANETRETWPRDRVAALAADCDAAIMFMPDTVNEAFLARCPRLKVIAAALKGRDNFDVEACTRRGVWLSIVPGLLTVPTAELGIALLLAVTRHLLAGDDHVRSPAFNGWRPLLYGTGLAGRTAGLVGLGAVGQAMAKRLAAFDVKLAYADPHPAPEALAKSAGLVHMDLDELLAASDFVFPLTHLTPETHHMIDAAALERMKRGAYLVNVGRGSLVDEAAVAKALAAGCLAGYAADVFELEDWALPTRPRIVHPALVADRERTFFTPHLGSAVDDVRRDIAMEAALNVLDVLRGDRPRGAVNSVAR